MSLVSTTTVDRIKADVDLRALGGKADVRGTVFRLGLLACMVFSLLALLTLLWTVWNNAQPVLTTRPGQLLTGRQSPNNLPALAGVAQGLRGTFWIAVIVVVVAVPLGISAATYLEEYASRSRFARFVEVNIRNLAGVPSVVYGLLGAGIFVETLGGLAGKEGVEARTLISGGLALAILALPVIIITASEAIRAVPNGLREGAYGVGATKWEVVRTQVLPYAAPGMLTGALLSIARAIGEAAPLIVIGAAASPPATKLADVLDPGALFERFTAMPITVNTWVRFTNEEYRTNNTAAAIVVLLVFVLALNSVAVLMRNRFERKRG